MIKGINANLYWGYVDLHEKIHIKRYRDDRHIRNAQDSGTTIGIFDPFEAENLEKAATMILEKYREIRHTVKKDIQ